MIAGSSAAVLSTTAGSGKSAAAPRANQLRQVDVRRDFGAIGDGATDDWLAIENAGLYLERLGGGRMYFPSGRYRLSGNGRNITVRSNVEYFGDGHSSVILGTNAAFVSPQGAAFGRSAYGSYDYMPTRDIKAGDRFLELRNESDALTFNPGDIVIARAEKAILTPGDVLPYYVEMNRVAAVAGNRLELEDAIDDGWSGVMAANVTRHVAQGYSIHDLRIECEAGYPFFIQGSYKSVIRNCWIRGYAVACCNGFTRSMAHDINASIEWSEAGNSASLFEVETGSVRANFHDIDVSLTGSVPKSARYPLFYCQEFSRRTLLRNIRVAAAGTDIGIVFQVMSGGHRIENVEILADTVDKVLDYSSCDPAAYQLNSLGFTLSNVHVETPGPASGLNHGFVLHNDYAGGKVENVAIRDCTLTGSTGEGDHHLIWFYKGIQKNILFENVRGPGLVTMNTSGLTPNEVGHTQGDLAFPLDNVTLRNCEYTRLSSEEMLKQARFISCERSIDGLPATVRKYGGAWARNAQAAEMTMIIPPSAAVCRGDAISLKLVGSYGAQRYPAHIRIKIMGAAALTLDLAANQPHDIEIDLATTFAGAAFHAPDRFTVSGPVRVNGVRWPDWHFITGSFDAKSRNTIEVHAWIDKPAADPAAIDIAFAAIEFRAAESRQ